MEKELFISSVELLDFDGANHIPTIIYYDSSKQPSIGYDAQIKANNISDINMNFKVDLGNESPDNVTRKTFTVANIGNISAHKLTSDFIRELLHKAEQNSAGYSLTNSTILIAEPLSMESGLVTREWLSNYRRSLRKILAGKKYNSVDFMPEPFAVFQYYRYGLRHPLVSSRKKMYVLVLDCGGGTSDSCVIETTHEGDIKMKGSNSKPLAACSRPVGGFFINRLIADHLLLKAYDKRDRKKLRTFLKSYTDWKSSRIDVDNLNRETRSFLKEYQQFIAKMEDIKLSLCRSIDDWNLESDKNVRIPVVVPKGTSGGKQNTLNLNLTSQDFRDIFEQKMWKNQLKPLLAETLSRAKDELAGAPITVVLLSGGSANIKWLKNLIERDFEDDLSDASVVNIKDFQEVVAKGLAIECARRFVKKDKVGDFSSMTYNRICLLLNPDNIGYEPRKFTSRHELASSSSQTAGVLLPSAQAMRKYVDKAITWKVKLPKPPKSKLEFVFLRSSFDPGNHGALLNPENMLIHTPKGTTFDSQIGVELIVKEDGTATPRFKYKTHKDAEKSIWVDGRPFYLDMTCIESSDAQNEICVGLDFGTSNTAVSLISQNDVEVIMKRTLEKEWKDLNSLKNTLPYPLAISLGKYIADTSQKKPQKLIQDFVEDVLAIAAYMTYLEWCTKKGRKITKHFGGFTQRSAGPLWAFFKEMAPKLKDENPFSGPFSKLLEKDIFGRVDQIVDDIAQLKHGKITEATKPDVVVNILANIAGSVFKDVRLGYFENIRKVKFSSNYKGYFKIAHGIPPFTEVLEYSGSYDFSENQCFIIHASEGRGLDMTPLMFWEFCQVHKDYENGHLYMYDIGKKETYEYKAAGCSCSLDLSSRDDYQSLLEQLNSMRIQDKDIQILSGMKIENCEDN